MASDSVGSLGFFTGVSVDDKKYESLLEDLRAHDLLGPVDDALDNYPYPMGTTTASSRPFVLHDNLSAIFMGNVHMPGSEAPPANEQPKPKGKVSAPPGFAAAPQGAAPTQADLEWARSQQEFAMLREEFSKKAAPETAAFGFGNAGLGISSAPSSTSAYLYAEDDEDDGILEDLKLKSLGLTEDEETAAPAKALAVPPPLPTTMPTPPPGWGPPAGALPPPGMMPPPGTMPPPGAMPLPTGNMPRPPPGWRPEHGPPPHPQGMMPPHGFPHHPPPHMLPPHMMPPPHMMMRPPFPPPPHVLLQERVFQVMMPRDIQFVVQQELKQIRSSDPFSDDYYFHNYMVKRDRARQQALPGQPPLPLPSWKLEHVKSFDPRDVSRANKSRTWETENHVLGRTAKTSLYRPRELLNLHKVDEQPKDVTVVDVLNRPEEELGASVFRNEAWSKRQRIDAGIVHLLALQDARHLLDARRVNVQQFHQMDTAQMDPALIKLRERTTRLLLDLASVLGVSTINGEATCDPPALEAILSVSKGKKLVCRALPLLHPSARFVLFPFLVQYMLAQTQRITDQLTADEAAADDRLAQTLVVTMMYHSVPADVLAKALAYALDRQSLASLSLVLHHRSRAELLQALLQKGGTTCETAAEDVKAAWMKYQDRFVDLASQIKEAAMQQP
ncbi:hypothetical protein SDRG_06498 [Saprolegnia diclina VS20]|uniref:mRNA decay factor PAT1 domain-containing protein n=1 Tax=Saprolegnia diclina (strain VS20) TaxID=1156394 RepID=T0QCW3_SAPDV|nr:hypothetical protein SDRG_06498 [Saprolegnia diclina VS20]EQC35739.1 hypothetical protein SDRG_06498 [Saprolegnia diclina VS20]|eukprot:XP_008610501.1 hypothetical protein SDRG_06498 [Saprolegnia diclina VS20]